MEDLWDSVLLCFFALWILRHCDNHFAMYCSATILPWRLLVLMSNIFLMDQSQPIFLPQHSLNPVSGRRCGLWWDDRAKKQPWLSVDKTSIHPSITLLRGCLHPPRYWLLRAWSTERLDHEYFEWISFVERDSTSIKKNMRKSLSH